MSKSIVGIDLGTTISAIAHLNSMGKAEIARVDEDYLVPSLVFFHPDKNEILVGAEAKAQGKVAPKRFISQIKREMHNLEYTYSIDGKDWTPPEISALILKKIVEGASQDIKEIKDVVISVPAYFKDQQRDATVKAGQLAGLNVIGLVNEPTAAALYYATERGISGKTLIFDMGGGTTDVTIVDVKGSNVEIIGSHGNAHLGGVDFDLALFGIIEQAYKAEHGGDLVTDDSYKMVMLQTAEELKKKLTRKDSVKTKAKGKKGLVQVEITRHDFEEAISEKLHVAEMLIEAALEDAGITAESLGCVALVGGSTRIPAVRAMIENATGKEPVSVGNVDQAVALGAAIFAGMRTLEIEPSAVPSGVKRTLNSVALTEVSNFGLGVLTVIHDEVSGRHVDTNSILIKKNTPLPADVTETYYTVSDGQDGVRVRVTQGESADPEEVDIIFEKEVQFSRPRPVGHPVSVTYGYDINGLLEARIKEEGAGNEVRFEVHPPAGGAEQFDDDRSVIDSFIIE